MELQSFDSFMVEIVSTKDEEEPELVLDLDAFLSSEDRLLLDGAGEECMPESGLPVRLIGREGGASPAPRCCRVCRVEGGGAVESASTEEPSSRAGRADAAAAA